MMAGLRLTLLLALAAACLVAGWRILAHALADADARRNPAAALAWIPGHPEALLALAATQRVQGDDPAATATARHLLDIEPLEGRGWTLLGDIAIARGDMDAAKADYAKAIALEPRNATARAWLAEDAFSRRDFDAALVQIDHLWRTTPEMGDALIDVLSQWAVDPDFRTALVATLATEPPWRADFIARLSRSNAGEIRDAVFSDLREQGSLSRADNDAWIDALIARGDWLQAYARWAATLPAGTVLSPVHNPDFVRIPSNRGFDWRSPSVPGLDLEFPPGQGARIDYRNRRIAHGGLEQALILRPGTYRLDTRMRSRDLRAERGLEWIVVCAGDGAILGRTPPIRGSGDWKDITATVQVPASCERQWLRLRNATSAPALQTLSGTLEIATVRIEPLDP